MKNILIRLSLALAVVLSLVGWWQAPGPSNVQAAGENWLSGWSNRLPLTIDHTKVTAALTSFPLLINLGTASGIDKADTSSVLKSLGANSKRLAVTAADGVSQLRLNQLIHPCIAQGLFHQR